jgi:hypothetical protein
MQSGTEGAAHTVGRALANEVNQLRDDAGIETKIYSIEN